MCFLLHFSTPFKPFQSQIVYDVYFMYSYTAPEGFVHMKKMCKRYGHDARKTDIKATSVCWMMYRRIHKPGSFKTSQIKWLIYNTDMFKNNILIT